MPKIPIYNQQLVPNASPGGSRISPDNAGAGLVAIGSGIDKIGAALEHGSQVDFALEKQQISLNKERAETQDRIWAANAASRSDLELAGQLSQDQLAAGPGADNFTPTFLNERVSKVHDKYLADAPSDNARNLAQMRFAQSYEAFGRAATGFEAKAKFENTVNLLGETNKNYATLVAANPALSESKLGDAISLINNSATIDAGTKVKLREDARHQIVNASVVSWIKANPDSANTVLKDMMKAGNTDSDVSWVSNGEKYSVPIKLGTLQERMKWQEYADKLVKEKQQDVSIALRYEIQDAETQAKMGVAPTTKERPIEDFYKAFPNKTQADHEYQRYTVARSTATAMASFQKESTESLLAIMNKKPDAADPNFTISAQKLAIQAKAAADIIRTRQDDPTEYALQTGDFKLSPLDISKKDVFVAELKRRSAAAPEMNNKYGTWSMVSKNEAGMLARGLDSLDSKGRVDMLDSIRKGINDNTIYSSLLQAIRKDSPVTALVGNIANAGFRSNAEAIAIGEDLLNPTKASKDSNGGKGSAFPMPPDKNMQTVWAGLIGDAYRVSPSDAMTAYQAFRAHLASSRAKSGDMSGKEISSSSDETIAALKAATGGVMAWGGKWFTGTTQANIVLPYGMPEDVFRDKAQKAWLKVRKDDHGFNKMNLDAAGLENTGINGEYKLVAGKGYALNKFGKEIILKVE